MSPPRLGRYLVANRNQKPGTVNDATREIESGQSLARSSRQMPAWMRRLVRAAIDREFGARVGGRKDGRNVWPMDLSMRMTPGGLASSEK